MGQIFLVLMPALGLDSTNPHSYLNLARVLSTVLAWRNPRICSTTLLKVLLLGDQ
jgi:hypothetical protein